MTRKPQRPIDARAVDTARAHVLRNEREKLARQLLNCVCEPTRLNILRALRAGPLAASDLAYVLGRTRSATSQHLRVLRTVNAIVAERRGNVIRYQLGAGPQAAVLAEIADAFDVIRAA